MAPFPALITGMQELHLSTWPASHRLLLSTPPCSWDPVLVNGMTVEVKRATSELCTTLALSSGWNVIVMAGAEASTLDLEMKVIC